MDRSRAYVSYALSFCWIVGLVAVAIGARLASSMVLEYLARGGSNRSFLELLGSLAVMTVIFMVLAAGAALVTLIVPQAFEALLAEHAMHWVGGKARFLVLLAVPLTAALTWYCYDNFLPDISFGPDDGPDWKPYEHGITTARYLKALAVQAPLSLFNVLYFDSAGRPGYRRVVRLIAVFATVVVGGIWAFLRTTR